MQCCDPHPKNIYLKLNSTSSEVQYGNSLSIFHCGLESHLHRSANSLFVQAIGKPSDNSHLLDQTITAYQHASAHHARDFVLSRFFCVVRARFVQGHRPRVHNRRCIRAASTAAGPLYGPSPLPPSSPGACARPFARPYAAFSPVPMPPLSPGPSEGAPGTPSGKPVGINSSRLVFSAGSPNNLSLTGSTGGLSVSLVVGAMIGLRKRTEAALLAEAGVGSFLPPPPPPLASFLGARQRIILRLVERRIDHCDAGILFGNFCVSCVESP